MAGDCPLWTGLEHRLVADPTKEGSVSTRLVVLAGILTAAVLLLPEARVAGEGFHPALRHKKCPPYCDPCFGYIPTQWRPWPPECGVGHQAFMGGLPPSTSFVDSLPAPRGLPGEQIPHEPGKNGPREPAPSPKPDDSSRNPRPQTYGARGVAESSVDLWRPSISPRTGTKPTSSETVSPYGVYMPPER
jgi:hypothetical protein